MSRNPTETALGKGILSLLAGKGITVFWSHILTPILFNGVTFPWLFILLISWAAEHQCVVRAGCSLEPWGTPEAHSHHCHQQVSRAGWVDSPKFRSATSWVIKKVWGQVRRSACESVWGWRPVRGTRVRHIPWLVGTFIVTRQCQAQSGSNLGIKGQGLMNGAHDQAQGCEAAGAGAQLSSRVSAKSGSHRTGSGSASDFHPAEHGRSSPQLHHPVDATPHPGEGMLSRPLLT